MNLNDTVGTVLDVKGTTVWSVRPDVTVFDAVAQMAQKDVGALLVMTDARLDGLFSERDYARKIILKGKNSRETAVAEVMTEDPIFVSRNHTVEECMRTMTEHRIRHLPVLDGERVVGVVSIGDLVNWIMSAQREEIQQLQSYITGSYPA